MLGCQHRCMLDQERWPGADPAYHRLYKVRGLLYMELSSWDAAYHDLWRAPCYDSQDEQCVEALMHVLEQLQVSAPHPQ
ncbi:hypothetical protein KSX_95350 [Ktedonospora formicarum]|uniref:Uncharacterized protein n=2 Tax=Ktedonospora formicarum TaxID=2778364 RepID=A0A8J3MWF0_9CHLR|nr:hypothetical protein KSX_95350 [Ktedonospora formicarum]